MCGVTLKYVRDAKSSGIRLAIGYVCATSMVKLGEFDKNWSSDFPEKFFTALRRIGVNEGSQGPATAFLVRRRLHARLA